MLETAIEKLNRIGFTFPEIADILSRHEAHAIHILAREDVDNALNPNPGRKPEYRPGYHEANTVVAAQKEERENVSENARKWLAAINKRKGTSQTGEERRHLVPALNYIIEHPDSLIAAYAELSPLVRKLKYRRKQH